jgi:hypothetical protein
MSTTTNPGGVFSGNTRFEVFSRNGVSIERLSQYGHEAEVLFSPGSHFRILSVVTDPSTGKTIIRLAEIP